MSLLEEHILQWRFVEVQLLEPNININMVWYSFFDV